ncbi:MAG: ADOP family duplicated permease [Bryobacteraceae bacterium]
MKRITLGTYQWIAQSFPETFLRAHGDDMVYASKELIEEVAAREGTRGILRMAPGLLADLLRRITVEYAAECWQDLKYAMRNLRRQKGMALLSIVSLSLGISMVTSMYSQFESTMFRVVPGESKPEELLSFQRPISFPDYEQIRDASGQFREFAAYIPNAPVMAGIGRKSERRWAHIVTLNYFQTLGARVVRGRAIGEEDRRGAAVAVIGHRLWREQFGSDPGIVGQGLRLNGKSVTVVGIAAPEFRGTSPMLMSADLWLPVTVGANVAPELSNGLLEKRVASFQAIGRLKAGIGTKQAEATLDAQIRSIEIQAGDPNKDRKGRRVTLMPGGRVFPIRNEDIGVTMGLPLSLITLMLWIACANVATLVLAKALARRKEIGIRLSLGASRARLIHQLLTESMVLAVAGGVLGLVWALWSTRLLDIYKPVMPGYVDLTMSISWVALAVTFAASVLTGIFCGLTPALQATKTDLASALKGVAQGQRARWWSSRNLLVLQQVAASLALLLITGFVVIGFNRNSRIDVGFDSSNLYQFSLDPLRAGYSSDRTIGFFRNLKDEVERIPGVVSAALAERAPMDLGRNVQTMATKSDFEEAKRQVRTIRVDRVGPGFFETAGVSVLSGREFRASDVESSESFAVVNQEMAGKVWPEKSPVGEMTEIAGKPHRVLGVVKTIRSGSILPMSFPTAYALMGADDYLKPLPEGMTLLVRAQPGFDAVNAVQQTILSRDPEFTFFHSTSVAEQIANGATIARMVSYTYGGMGAYGLLLAAIGLAGVTAQAVVRRTKEIGIRMALGAQPGNILRLVMKEGFLLTAAGTAIGVAGALALAKLLGAFFAALSDMTKTTMTDPLIIVGGPLLSFALTLVACFWPASRSIRIDPVRAIREESS